MLKTNTIAETIPTQHYVGLGWWVIFHWIWKSLWERILFGWCWTVVHQSPRFLISTTLSRVHPKMEEGSPPQKKHVSSCSRSAKNEQKKKKKCWTPRSKKPQCRYGLSNSQTRYLESSGLKRSIDWICHAQVMGRSTVALLAAFINIIRGSAHNNSYCEPCKGLHSLRWKRVRRTVPGIRYWIHSVLAAFTNGDWERVLSGSDG